MIRSPEFCGQSRATNACATELRNWTKNGFATRMWHFFRNEIRGTRKATNWFASPGFIPTT